MLLVLDDAQVPTDLAARRLACPSCPGRLRPWGNARPRVVRLLGGRRVRLIPRRARCEECRGTQVLLPAWCVPRRGHGIEVIGTALGARLAGRSHRAIAAELDVAADTVRGWLRRVTGRAEQLRCHAMRLLYDLDPRAGPADPAGSPLADALTALAVVVHAAQRRFGYGDVMLWPLLGQLGLARHLAPARGS